MQWIDLKLLQTRFMIFAKAMSPTTKLAYEFDIRSHKNNLGIKNINLAGEREILYFNWYAHIYIYNSYMLIFIYSL